MKSDDSVEARNALPSTGVLSLADVVAYVWRARVLVLALTAGSVIFGAAQIAIFSAYNSEGFLQFGGAIPDPQITDFTRTLDKAKTLGKEPPPGILYSDYKRIALVFLTRERFAEFVRSNNLADNPAANELNKSFDNISSMLQPVVAFAKEDAKLFEPPKGASNNVIGLRITARGPSPRMAQDMVSLLGRYVVDSIVRTVFSEAIQAQYAGSRIAVSENDQMLLTKMKQLVELERKSEALKEVMRRHPGSANLDSRQVISVTPDSTRFLSPLTLLVATEVEAFESREQIRNLQRRQAQGELLMEYFERIWQLFDKNPSGQEILRDMAVIREDMFQSRNMADQAIREVYNVIKIANQRSTTVYLEKTQFIAGPSLPTRSTPRPLLILALALVLGLVCSFLLVFARQWWIVNRATILGSR